VWLVLWVFVWVCAVFVVRAPFAPCLLPSASPSVFVDSVHREPCVPVLPSRLSLVRLVRLGRLGFAGPRAPSRAVFGLFGCVNPLFSTPSGSSAPRPVPVRLSTPMRRHHPKMLPCPRNEYARLMTLRHGSISIHAVKERCPGWPQSQFPFRDLPDHPPPHEGEMNPSLPSCSTLFSSDDSKRPAEAMSTHPAVARLGPMRTWRG